MGPHFIWDVNVSFFSFFSSKFCKFFYFYICKFSFIYVCTFFHLCFDLHCTNFFNLKINK
jgi:hypothetical protein